MSHHNEDVLIEMGSEPPSNEHRSQSEMMPVSTNHSSPPATSSAGSNEGQASSEAAGREVRRPLSILAKCGRILFVWGSFTFGPIMNNSSYVMVGFGLALSLHFIVDYLSPQTIALLPPITVSFSLKDYGCFWTRGVLGTVTGGAIIGLLFIIYAICAEYSRKATLRGDDQSRSQHSSNEVPAERNVRAKLRYGHLFATAVNLLSYAVVPLGGLVVEFISGEKDVVTYNLWFAFAANLLGVAAYKAVCEAGRRMASGKDTSKQSQVEEKRDLVAEPKAEVAGEHVV